MPRQVIDRTTDPISLDTTINGSALLRIGPHTGSGRSRTALLTKTEMRVLGYALLAEAERQQLEEERAKVSKVVTIRIPVRRAS